MALKQLRVSAEVARAVGCDVTLRLHLHLPSWYVLERYFCEISLNLD